MNIRIIFSALAIVMLVLLAGCSSNDNNSVNPVKPPTAPTNLVSTGSLNNIHLQWGTSSGGGLLGYYIYRSTNDTTFVKIDSTVFELEYNDVYVNDGVVYYYRITAKGDEESAPSNTVKDIHGTRLNASYASGLVITADSLNPYVAQDTVIINGGDITIQAGAQLYVKDGAVIDMEYLDAGNNNFTVNGLLRVVADPDSNATFTCHKTGGALADGEGFRLQFEDAVDYGPVEDTGCLIQNTRIINLHDSNQAIDVFNCSPKFYNCKITANILTGGSYFEIRGNSAPIIENCSVDNIVITVRTDLRGTQASIKKNRCREGYYSIYFSNQDNPAVDTGQVFENDFDGLTHGIYLFFMSGSVNVPLMNNYWSGGNPTIIQGGTTTISVDLTPTLASAPADCGPTW